MGRLTQKRDLSVLFDDDWSSGQTTLDAFLTKVLEVCVEWFDSAGVSLFIRHDLTGDYLLTAQSGPDSRVPDHTVIRAGSGIAGEAILKNKPLLVQDPDEIGKTGRRGAGSSLIVPLTTPESGCIGVINVFRAANQKPFDSEELQTASNLARYVGLAINNARLFARLNQAVGQSRALSDKLDAIIANLGLGVLVVSELEEITGWNPESQQIFGNLLQPGSTVQQLADSLAPAFGVALSEAYKEGAQKRATRRAYDSNTKKAFSIVASPLPAGGVTLAIQDVTTHEEALRELSRISRLAEIGQMTAAVAHEIRNPLTGIRSAAQMVQSLSDEGGEFGKIIEEEALKLNELCDQFLEFARPLQLNCRAFKFSTLVESILERHRPDFDATGVSLTLETPNKELWIEGDSLRTEQIVRNLILNALQACKSGGWVSVKVSNQGLEVSDSGIGLSKEQQNQLFTPFFTTKANGTGLGLSTVRKIVDAHGWSISVESQPSCGSTFSVSFKQGNAA